MPFINIFLKTLGFFTGVTVFVIILNILSLLISNHNQAYKFIDGDERSDNLIATLSLNGPIISNINNSLLNKVIEYIDPKVVKKNLEVLEKLNPKILIIKINSPGGTVTASASLEKIIEDFKNRNQTKIIFHSNDILASGGYWIATTGDKIYASYGSIIGSIGVSGPSWYYFDKPISISTNILGQKIETKNGIKIYDQNAGNSKDLYNPFRMPTEKELLHLQNIVKNIYNDFIIKVSSNRKIEVNILKNKIGALIYNSKQAKNNYLIDDVLDFDNLLKKIIKDNNYEDYKIIELYNKSNLLDSYISSYIKLDYDNLCNKLNSSFVVVLPTFFNRC